MVKIILGSSNPIPYYIWKKKKEEDDWVPKNWCFWTVVLEKTRESPLDSKEIKPVNTKGNKPWILIGKTDAEAEAPVPWPPDAKYGLIGKRPRWWEILMAEEGDDRGWNVWMASPKSIDTILSKHQELVMDSKALHATIRGLQRVRCDWTNELNLYLSHLPLSWNQFQQV